MLWEFFYFLNFWFKVQIRGYWKCGGFDIHLYEVVGVELFFPFFFVV